MMLLGDGNDDAMEPNPAFRPTMHQVGKVKLFFFLAVLSLWLSFSSLYSVDTK